MHRGWREVAPSIEGTCFAILSRAAICVSWQSSSLTPSRIRSCSAFYLTLMEHSCEFIGYIGNFNDCLSDGLRFMAFVDRLGHNLAAKALLSGALEIGP